MMKNEYGREWIQYPKNIPIETKFGTVFLSIVQGDYVYVDGSGNGKFITVADKKYTLSVRLHCYDGKTWEPGKNEFGQTHDSISSGTWQSYKAFDRMPPSYEKKAVAEIIEKVSAYLAANPAQLKAGAVADANNELAREEDKLAELEAQLKAQKALVADKRRAFEKASKA
jgi:hypothetical protein